GSGPAIRPARRRARAPANRDGGDRRSAPGPAPARGEPADGARLRAGSCGTRRRSRRRNARRRQAIRRFAAGWGRRARRARSTPFAPDRLAEAVEPRRPEAEVAHADARVEPAVIENEHRARVVRRQLETDER